MLSAHGLQRDDHSRLRRENLLLLSNNLGMGADFYLLASFQLKFPSACQNSTIDEVQEILDEVAKLARPLVSRLSTDQSPWKLTKTNPVSSVLTQI